MVKDNQLVQTNWNIFQGKSGTEEFWIVWSPSPVAQLETARDAAFNNPEGAITDAGIMRTLREFLSDHAQPKPVVTKDTAKKQTHIVSNGEVLVMLADLEHR